MTLEEARNIESLVKKIDETKEFLDFLTKMEGNFYVVYKSAFIDREIKIPEEIFEQLISLSKNYIKSLEREIENV